MTALLRVLALQFGFAFSAMPGAVAAQSNRFSVHTEPTLPVAGQPFAVIAISTECERLFLGNPYNELEPYQNVAVVGNTISVRVGYYTPVVCNNQPELLRLSVPGLPPGSYQLELVGRFLFTTDDNLLHSLALEIVAPAQAVPSARTMTAVLLAVVLAASGLLRLSHFTRRVADAP